MKTPILWISFLLIIFIFSSCRNDNVSPIRNVRFDPGLLNPLKVADDGPCATYSYQQQSQIRPLGNVYGRKVLVAFRDGYTYEQATAAMAGFGFAEGVGQAIQTKSGELYPVKLTEGLNCKQVGEAIKLLKQHEDVTYAAPYFLDGSASQLLGVSNEFLVTVNDKAQAQEVLKQLTSATRTEIVASLSEDTFVLRADKNSNGNALDMANFFQGQASVKHAEPNFIVSLER